MEMPSPFEVSRSIGNNIEGAFRQSQDNNTIENILSQAMQSEDPKVLQNSIGAILSKVSPERQGMAIQYLQNAYSNVQKKQEQEQASSKEQNAAKQAGYTYGVPPAVAAQQVKDKAKVGRLSQYGLGGEQQQGGQISESMPLPMQQGQSQIANQSSQQDLPGESVFKKLTDDQLVVASGAPDKEVSEPSKAELKRRADERNLSQKEKEGNRKYHTEISQDILKENEKESRNLVEAESALNLMENAITGKNLSFWSPDNLAEITGIEAFRSPEGAIFKTAGKEFFLGTLNRTGARPNQFIEQQIFDMLPKLGRSTEANLSVARAFRNEIDIKKEKVRLTRDLADELETKLGYVPRNIGQLRDEKLKEYAQGKQKELNNDLRAYKSIADKSSQPFMKVNPGTPVSKAVAKALLLQFKNDPEKASEEAKKLGYVF